MHNKGHISSRFSSNSEANASQLIENLEKVIVESGSWTGYCLELTATPPPP